MINLITATLYMVPIVFIGWLVMYLAGGKNDS